MARLAAAALASSLLFSASAAASAPEQKCPDQVATTGAYENWQYGFSIRVPEGLQGAWSSARCSSGDGDCVCMSDHGRIVPLSKDPEDPGYVEAYAAYNALDYATSDEAASEQLKWLRDDAANSRVTLLRRSAIRLAGIKATRSVSRYFSKKLRAWMIDDRINAIDGGVEFSLYLRTRESKLKRDAPLFEEIVKSWKRTAMGG